MEIWKNGTLALSLMSYLCIFNTIIIRKQVRHPFGKSAVLVTIYGKPTS